MSDNIDTGEIAALRAQLAQAEAQASRYHVQLNVEINDRINAEGERDFLRREIAKLQDNPELDATDAAHPAWWRGHDHACRVMCKEIGLLLDGDPIQGVCAEPWQSVRLRLANLAQPEGKPPEALRAALIAARRAKS